MSAPFINVTAIERAYDVEASVSALVSYQARLTDMRLDPDRVRALTAIAANEIQAALPLTESPIERDLPPWLVTGAYRSVRVSPLPVARPDRDPALLAIYSAILVPQLVVGRFRLDFALCLRRYGRLVTVAIECDGAEFHNPGRDAMRDAAFQAGGIVTVRASGSEIRRDPAAVVGRVDEALLTLTAGGRP